MTGEVCPRPALIVRNTLEDLEPGDELVVDGDYPPAEDNITRTCEKHGYEVTRRETDGDGDTFSLKIAVPDEAVGPKIED